MNKRTTIAWLWTVVGTLGVAATAYALSDVQVAPSPLTVAEAFSRMLTDSLGPIFVLFLTAVGTWIWHTTHQMRELPHTLKRIEKALEMLPELSERVNAHEASDLVRFAKLEQQFDDLKVGLFGPRGVIL